MKLRQYKLTHSLGQRLVEELVTWLPDGSVKRGDQVLLVDDATVWTVGYVYSVVDLNIDEYRQFTKLPKLD